MKTHFATTTIIFPMVVFIVCTDSFPVATAVVVFLTWIPMAFFFLFWGVILVLAFRSFPLSSLLLLPLPQVPL